MVVRFVGTEGEVISGATDTFIVSDLLTLPPVPVQVRVKVEVAVGETDCEPVIVLLPDQAPEAEQEVALVEDQERTKDWPEVIDVEFELKFNVVEGVVVTDTLTETFDVKSPNHSTPSLSIRHWKL